MFIVVCELQFKDKHTFYQWTINDPYEDFYQSRAEFYLKSIAPMLYSLPLANNYGLCAATSALFNGSLLPPLSSDMSTTNFDSLLVNSTANESSGDSGDDEVGYDNIHLGRVKSESPPKHSDLQNAIFLLSQLGPDSLLRVILSKPYVFFKFYN